MTWTDSELGNKAPKFQLMPVSRDVATERLRQGKAAKVIFLNVGCFVIDDVEEFLASTNVQCTMIFYTAE